MEFSSDRLVLVISGFASETPSIRHYDMYYRLKYLQ